MPLILRSVFSAKQVAKALRSLGIRFSEEDKEIITVHEYKDWASSKAPRRP